MKCSQCFAGLLLACLLLLLPRSASAQCPQGNCPDFTIIINGVPNNVQHWNSNMPVISTGANVVRNTVGFVANGTRNVVVGTAATVRNTTALGANVIVAPLSGSLHTFSYVQPQYSSAFRHYQSGGPFTRRVTVFRFRR